MEHFRSIYQCIFISLLVTTWLSTFSKGASVSLTVEEGVSLVGSHCPGTVRLSCEGVDLTSLRWRYNGNIIIISYFPDSISSAQPAESAFFMAQLIAVAQNPSDPNIANFSSILIVNLLQLQSNDVSEISCSDPGVSQVEPVNVNIIEPNSPTINMVTAAYRSGELNSLNVTWMKSDTICFSNRFIYEVNLTAHDLVLVNHSSCGEVCMISFNNLTGRAEEFAVSIRAENDLGASDITHFPTIITHQVQHYFIPQVLYRDRQLFGQCTAAGGFVGSTICTIQYTTDSMYRNLSNEAMGSLDTELSLVEGPISNTTYYFLFTVLVNNTFQVTDKFIFRFSVQADTVTGVPSWGIALIVIIVIVFLVAALMMTVIMSITVTSRQAKTKRNPDPDTENQVILDEPPDDNKTKLVGEEDELKKSSVELKQIPRVTKEDSQPDQAERSKKVTTDSSKGIRESVEGIDSPFQEEARNITASVVDFEKRFEVKLLQKEEKPYTVYKVIVKRKDESHIVFKRYKEFKELYDHVKKDYSLKLKFPGKQIVGNLDPEFIKSRQEALHNFIDNLMKTPNIDRCLQVRQFLALDDFSLEPEGHRS